MPVCSYIVLPRGDAIDAVEARLRALPGCEVVRADNRDLLLLVTDTTDLEEEQRLAREVRALDGILDVVLAFGELEPGSPLVPLGGRARRGAL